MRRTSNRKNFKQKSPSPSACNVDFHKIEEQLVKLMKKLTETKEAKRRKAEHKEAEAAAEHTHEKEEVC